MRDWPAIPGYEIVGVLGQGVTATVYEAREKNLGRKVALKVFNDESQGREEFEALSRCVSVDSPHVTRVHRAAVEGGIAFVEMELLPGHTLLGKILAEGRLPPGEAVRTLLGVLDGLYALHRAGLVHRDVKPANIFLAEGPDGAIVKLGDFGLVRSEEGPATLPRGTPGYVPPEASGGEGPNRVVPSQDVYAAGAVLFCCLTGRDPDRFWPLHLRPVPPTLRPILRTALAGDPGERFPGVVEMRAALVDWMETKPSIPRWAAAGVLIIAVVALVAGLLLGDGEPEEDPEPPPAPVVSGQVTTTDDGPVFCISGIRLREASEGDPLRFATRLDVVRLSGDLELTSEVTRIEWTRTNWNRSSGWIPATRPWSVTISLESGKNAMEIRGLDLVQRLVVVSGGAFALGDNSLGQLGNDDSGRV